MFNCEVYDVFGSTETKEVSWEYAKNVGYHIEHHLYPGVPYYNLPKLHKLLMGNQSYKEQITFVKDRAGHDFRYAIDASKIENNLGWKADENFETGIQKTIEWYLNKYQ